MGFFEHAWKAAAETYGARRAEQYGRIAKVIEGARAVGVVLLFVAILVMIVKHY